MGTQDRSFRARASTPSYFTMRRLLASSESESIDALEDWEQLRARIPAVPKDASIRGMFPKELMQSAPHLKSPRERYLPFSSYPMSEYLELILLVAQDRYPQLSPADAVLKVGLNVYTTFASSLAGVAIFSMAQLDIKRTVELAPKAYDVTLRPGQLHVVECNEGHAVVQLRNVWAFPDIFHAGIWLGAMQSFRTRGSIEVTRCTLSEVDFELRWEPTTGQR